MFVFVVKRYAVREGKKWRYAVRKAKKVRSTQWGGVSPSLLNTMQISSNPTGCD